MFLILNNVLFRRKLEDLTTESTNLIVKEMLVKTFVETAPSITITTLTNILAFGIGALTPTPEIQLFSIGNALALTFDYIFQWTIFGSFMAIVGRIELSSNRLIELEGLQKQSWIEPIRQKVRHKFALAMKWYCRTLTNGFVSSLVMGILAVYLCLSIYGIMNIKAELQPMRLFAKDSDVLRVCLIFLKNYSTIYFRSWI